MELCPKHIDESRKRAQNLNYRLETICSPIQKFKNYEYKLSQDVILCYWTLGFFLDKQAVTFLEKCRHFARGLVIIWENFRDEDSKIVDEQGYRTRTKKQYLAMFEEANLQVMKTFDDFQYVEDENWDMAAIWVLEPGRVKKTTEFETFTKR